MSAQDTAYRMGWVAAIHGKPRGSCPYKGAELRAWKMGYTDALAEKERDAEAVRRRGL